MHQPVTQPHSKLGFPASIRLLRPASQPRTPAKKSSNGVLLSRLTNEKKPFGERAEGLYHCRGRGFYAFVSDIQKRDFENSLICVVMGGKPFVAKGLQKSQRPGRQFRRFSRLVERVGLELGALGNRADWRE